MAQSRRKRVPAPIAAIEKQVLGYIRLTREKSLKTDLSAPAQRREIKSYAQQASLPVPRILEESEATPGDLPFVERKAGKELWEAIASGDVGHVVVRELDRLVRSDDVWPRLRDLLLKHGVTLHTLTGPVPLNSPSDRFATNVRVAAFVLEREQTSERGRRAKREGARQGRFMGGPAPYGYTSQARYQRELQQTGLAEADARINAEGRFPHRARLYKDAKEASIVRIIFDHYVRKRTGCRMICTWLNGRGYRRRSGKPWCPDKVRRVLMDPVVAGYVPFDEQRFKNRHKPATPKPDQELHSGQHVAIVSEAVWQKAQSIRKSNRHVSGRGDASGFNRKYPLSGVLLCPCGAKMRVASQQRKLGFVYYCCGRRRDFGPTGLGGCDRPRVAVDKVEAAVWSSLSEVLTSEPVVKDVHQAAWLEIRQRHRRKFVDKASSQELATVEANLVKWYAYHDAASGGTEKNAAWRRVVELTALKEELVTRVTSPEDVVDPPVVTERAVREFLGGLVKHMANADDRGAKIVHTLVRDHQLEVRLVDAGHISIRMALRPLGAAIESFEHAVPIEHTVRLPPGRADAWHEENNGKHSCEICGDVIELTRRHFWKGIPTFHRSCHVASLAHSRNPDPRRYYTGSEAARRLGISRSTFGRWMTSGKVNAKRRVSNVLLFSKKTINSLSKSS